MTATTHTTPLRQRLIEQMQIANLADTTRECDVREIRRLAEHYGQSPDRLDAEQIRAWIMILIERGLSPASVNVTIAAFKFFFRDTLARPEIIAGLRNRKVPRKLPRYLEVSEVERLLLATPDLRDRAAMLLAYASRAARTVNRGARSRSRAAPPRGGARPRGARRSAGRRSRSGRCTGRTRSRAGAGTRRGGVRGR